MPEENILKAPSHKWLKFLWERQTLTELHALDWSIATGVGTFAGFNNLRALDIDGCKDNKLINEFLELLELPSDYDWVVQSGSKNGYHIIFLPKSMILSKTRNVR